MLEKGRITIFSAVTKETVIICHAIIQYQKLDNIHNVIKKVTVAVQIKVNLMMQVITIKKYFVKYLNRKGTTDLSPDENDPVLPGFTQLRSGRIALDYRLRKHTFEVCNNSL